MVWAHRSHMKLDKLLSPKSHAFFFFFCFCFSNLSEEWILPWSFQHWQGHRYYKHKQIDRHNQTHLDLKMWSDCTSWLNPLQHSSRTKAHRLTRKRTVYIFFLFPNINNKHSRKTNNLFLLICQCHQRSKNSRSNPVCKNSFLRNPERLLLDITLKCLSLKIKQCLFCKVLYRRYITTMSRLVFSNLWNHGSWQNMRH